MTGEDKYQLTQHAREEAERRGIALSQIDDIMNDPEQVIETYNDRRIYQSRIEVDDKLYLFRVIVELTKPLTVVTVYRTSKIDKYWSNES